jgi:hypothetical protein
VGNVSASAPQDASSDWQGLFCLTDANRGFTLWRSAFPRQVRSQEYEHVPFLVAQLVKKHDLGYSNKPG